jgi:hypothetical protein
VALRAFEGLTGSKTLAHTTTGAAGGYQLSYVFTSVCGPQDNTLDWIEVSAEGYATTSTLTFDPSLPTWPSDPPIYCTSDPQVINLSLQPFGFLRVTTTTGGPGLDSDGYALIVGQLGYPMGMNDDRILPEVPGQYSLELTEVAANCAVAGDNPRTVAVAARDTAVSTFQVTCAP